jgi:hypothetical protein
LIARNIERKAEKAHEHARAAVLAAESGSGRFALFVRVFSPERDLPTLYPVETYASRYILEQKLVKLLKNRMPIMTIANPGDDIPPGFLESGVLRLFAKTSQWQNVFRRLASLAALIIILDEESGPGYLYELSTIDELQRQPDSVVITDEDYSILTFNDRRNEFTFENYEDMAVMIRRFREEKAEELAEVDEPVPDPLKSDLLARITGSNESGLVKLHELLKSGRFDPSPSARQVS